MRGERDPGAGLRFLRTRGRESLSSSVVNLAQKVVCSSWAREQLVSGDAGGVGTRAEREEEGGEREEGAGPVLSADSGGDLQASSLLAWYPCGVGVRGSWMGRQETFKTR